MRTILVPVDFTSTTENAVKTAADWAAVVPKYHSSENGRRIRIRLPAHCGRATHLPMKKVSMPCCKERNYCLIRWLRLLQKSPWYKSFKNTKWLGHYPKYQWNFKKSIELIILGSDDETSTHESFVSDHIISIARTSPVKTLIVPNSYHYSPVKNIFIPCDLKGIKDWKDCFIISISFINRMCIFCF
jgi:hypothetical protein